MEGLSVHALGVGGAVAVLLLGILLWRLFKLALKVVVFVVATALIALAVVVAVQHGGVSLPLPPLPGQTTP